MPVHRLQGQEAVTPVIGSILILAITVLGVAGIMLWGAPAIQRIQDQNAQLAMVGEFQDLRQASLALSVPDATRTPTVIIQDGTIGIRNASRFLVAASHDLSASYLDCNFHASNWHSGAADSFTVTNPSCRIPLGTSSCTPPLSSNQACLQVFKVTGNNLIERSPVVVAAAGANTYTVSVAGQDFTKGNWAFLLTNGEVTTRVVHAQVWLASSAMHYWEMQSNVGDRGVYHDGGAVFSRHGQSWFLEKGAAIQEDAFGTGEFVFWLRTYSAMQPTAFTGRGDVTVELGLVGSYTRIDSAAVRTVRLDFHGELSEPWCNAILDRNDIIPDSELYSLATADCTVAVPSLKYQRNAGATAFRFEFLDAHIRTAIKL
jgi:hypothetical protein